MFFTLTLHSSGVRHFPLTRQWGYKGGQCPPPSLGTKRERGAGQASEAGPAGMEAPPGCREQLALLRYVLYISSFLLSHEIGHARFCLGKRRPECSESEGCNTGRALPLPSVRVSRVLKSSSAGPGLHETPSQNKQTNPQQTRYFLDTLPALKGVGQEAAALGSLIAWNTPFPDLSLHVCKMGELDCERPLIQACKL